MWTLLGESTQRASHNKVELVQSYAVVVLLYFISRTIIFVCNYLHVTAAEVEVYFNC